MHTKTIVVGMSGGVDSSLTAALLKESGAHVIGLFMKNWEEKCPLEDDYEDVATVCDQLQIPFYTVNFAKEYWDNVFSKCLLEYQKGLTPNPDILCNREIKFKVFFDKAMELGADYLATGHYCQVGPHATLLRGVDPDKDQSYFLYTVKQEILKKVLFPIGHLPKAKVRAMAYERGLCTAAKKDSTGICFIGKRNFKQFLSNYLKPNPGHFETPEGDIVGQHDGIAYYTIGQRRGLSIGGPGEAWYIAGKDAKRNVVTVVQGEDHPLLYQTTLIANEESFISQTPPFPLHCTAKVRYRQTDAPCLVERLDSGHLKVTFETPQKAITPRQSIVFYQGPLCLGGAMISDTTPLKT